MTLCVCFSENGPRYVSPFRVVYCFFHVHLRPPQTRKSLENIAGLWRRVSKRQHARPAYRGQGPVKITDIHRVLDITSQVDDEYEDPLWLVRCDPVSTSIGAGTSAYDGPSSTSSNNFTDPDQPLRRRWDQHRCESRPRVVRQEKLARTVNLHPFDDAILSPLQRMTDRVAVAHGAPLSEHCRARLRPGPCAHLPIVRKPAVPFASPSQRLVESCPPLPSISHPRIDLRRAVETSMTVLVKKKLN